jgi:glutamate/aspartate transport system substrate-binding protein
MRHGTPIKVLAALLILNALAVVPAIAETTLEKVARTATITLGVREGSYPLSYALPGPEYVGYHLDICRNIAQATANKLGLAKIKLDYVPVTSSNRIPMTVAGRIDLECGSTTNNSDRQAQVAFAPTTFVTAVRVAVRKDSGIRSLAGLMDNTVVTTKGSTSVQLLRARINAAGGRIHQVFGEDHAQSFKILEQGQAAAFVMDDNLLAGLIALSPDPDAYEMVGPSISIEPIAIMLRKDDPDFKALVDDSVRDMMRRGEVAKLYDKWFRSPIPPKGINLDLPMSAFLRQMILYPNDDPAESFQAPE